MRFKAGLEERMARIEGVLEQMDKRLTDFRALRLPGGKVLHACMQVL